METLIKLNATRSGHDKIMRTAQYTLRLITMKPGTVQDLSAALGAARKLNRFGTVLSVMLSSTKTVKHPDLIIRTTCTLSRISSAMYLFCDHLLYLHQANLLKVDCGKWSRFSIQCWLYSIVLNLLRDVYEIQRLVEQLKSEGKSDPYKKCDLVTIIATIAKQNRDVCVDLFKNLADFVLPLSSLGYIDKQRRLVSLCGLVSSILGILPMINPKYKMYP